MVQVRVEIDRKIYHRLKQTFLKYKTWRDIINEALAEYLEKREDDYLEKKMMAIVRHYYELSSIKRVLSMYIYLKNEYRRIMTMQDTNYDETIAEITSKLMDIINRLEKEIAEIEKEKFGKGGKDEQ